MTISVADLAKRFTGSYLGHDPDPDFLDLFADVVRAKHNFDVTSQEYAGRELAEQMLTRREAIRQVMPDFDVIDFTVHIAEDAFIIVQTSVGTLPDGTAVRIPGVVVFDVADGRIVAINSVRDESQAADLENAMRAAG
ncbi:nuclear transport factor 2 family protein [Amycolatopsis pigmentata]|uniref:Nuclear transport factor 2 family protein n=1 Tax=Amycolatopsis pigmentata TaxID=450801 RepID=A0ABW5FN85_9PSEU